MAKSNARVLSMSGTGVQKGEEERKEVTDLLRMQIAVEGELVRLYEETVRNITSSPVMHLLHILRLDSRKHIEICQAAVEVLEGQQMLLPEKEELIEGLRRHVELEKEAIARTSRILDNIWISQASGLKELIEKLRNDEIGHHRMLLNLVEKRF